MMIGSGLMLGMGLLIMLFVFGLPILLVLVVIGGAGGLFHNQNQQVTAAPNTRPVYTSGNQLPQPASSPARYCAHCGAGLQADWTHCPQCGAPIGE